ncbi:MAG: hypothetical protein EXR50_01980 [Dehalococcoidia bacterium]|nr:hypothetical protein [Dehalococcoidia bacterium]
MSHIELSSEALLVVLQLADSAFPTGMYAHSHGLEGMVRRDLVRTPSDVETLLRNQLVMSVLPADGVALLETHSFARNSDVSSVQDIDWLLFVTKLPSELRAASCQVGRRMLAEAARFTDYRALITYRDAVTRNESPGNGAVALGVVAAALEVPAEAALLAMCHSHAVSVLGAAMRLLPLSHSDVQGILSRLRPVIASEARNLRGRTWQEMASFTPQLDLLSECHAQDDLRMFAS